MRAVYATGDPLRASIAKQALSESGIAFTADQSVASGLVTGQPTSFPHVTFQVQDGDFDRAETAIREAVNRIPETSKPDESPKKES